MNKLLFFCFWFFSLSFSRHLFLFVICFCYWKSRDFHHHGETAADYFSRTNRRGSIVSDLDDVSIPDMNNVSVFNIKLIPLLQKFFCKCVHIFYCLLVLIMVMLLYYLAYTFICLSSLLWLESYIFYDLKKYLGIR